MPFHNDYAACNKLFFRSFLRYTNLIMAITFQRNIWIDYLRSFVTVLVVAHHASLAYTTFAYFDKDIYINSTAPVVDNARWIGMDIFENFNDIFFMSLMYFISGLFVYNAIVKKGTMHFLSDRSKRLGLPFLIAVTFIIPIAYVPSFYLAHHQFTVAGFITDYLFTQQWPVGPPWFIWLLLLFNLIAAFIPVTFYKTVFHVISNMAKKPLLFVFICFAFACLAFIPISLAVGQYTWTGFGPFDFQVNRFFLYLLFFLFGVCLGSGDWEHALFVNKRLLAIRWQFWALLCIISYLLVEWATFYGADLLQLFHVSATGAWFIFDLCFVASCLSSSFAFIAFFNSKTKHQHPGWSSLSANAYGIYLIHYVFVTWLQFALLNNTIPLIFKFLIVFFGSLMLSWLFINQIRKYKAIKNLI